MYEMFLKYYIRLIYFKKNCRNRIRQYVFLPRYRLTCFDCPIGSIHSIFILFVVDKLYRKSSWKLNNEGSFMDRVTIS